MKRILHIVEKLVAELREANSQSKGPAQGNFCPHCLIVEDNDTDAQLAKRAIEEVPCVTADIATTGDRAIELLREAKATTRPPYHILFLDLNLVGSAAQGYEVLRWVRKECPAVHVVIVSGHYDEGVINFIAGDRGSGGYLGIIKKPLHESNLREILDKHQLAAPDFQV